MKLIVIDNETGGVEPQCSLLTSTLKVIDLDGNVLSSLRLYCKPNDGFYVLDAGGMSVNRIDIVDHHTRAKTYKECGTILYNWLNEVTDQAKEKLTPLGHGVAGDIEDLCKIININTWHNFCSHNVIDTITLVKWAKVKGIVPEDHSLSLGKIAQFFGVEVDEAQLHDDNYDVDINIQLYLALKGLL